MITLLLIALIFTSGAGTAVFKGLPRNIFACICGSFLALLILFYLFPKLLLVICLCVAAAFVIAIWLLFRKVAL